MNIEQTLDYIHSLSRFGKKNQLENIKLILEKMDNPQNKLKFIHIAGTNGKGSAANFISSGLIDANIKVGLFTSPYLEKFNERIQINGVNIPDDELCEITEYVKKVIESIENSDCYPIEFEVITAIAMEYFKRNNCDIVVLETGIGGRLDSTNIIENPLVCVITAIGYDHVKYLGNSISDIAYEKSGIIKNNSYVVAYPKIDSVSKKMVALAALNTNSILCRTKQETIISMDVDGSKFIYNNEEYEIGMIGEHQIYNSICAIETLKYLQRFFKITPENIKNGLKKSKWKCRFEKLGKNDDVIIDGAHNNHAIKEFCKVLENQYKDKKKIVIMGMLEEKDYQIAIENVANVADELIITKVFCNRENDAREIYREAMKWKSNVIFKENNSDALEYAYHMRKGDCKVFVVGSLYLAGNMRGFVDKFF